MNQGFRLILFLCFLIVGSRSYAQEVNQEKSVAGNSSSAAPSMKIQRKEARKKWKDDRKREKETRKLVKEHHDRLQTKEVRKRMKRNKYKSKMANEHRKEFFLDRWLSR